MPVAEVWELLCRLDPMRLGRSADARFEWTRDQGMACLEEFAAGPLVRVWAGFELEPAGHGTRVRAFIEVTPRSRWIQPFLPFLCTRRLEAVLRACKKREAEKRAGRRATAVPASSRLRRWLWARRLDVFIPGRSESWPLLDRLKRHLVESDDAAVSRLSPFALADRWGADRQSVLKLFLYAAHEGMLVYSWEIRCPHCRLVPVVVPSLNRLPPLFHCAHCDLDQETDLSRNVELSFAVSPRVRRVRRVPVRPPRHPSRHEKILALRPLSAGTSRTIRLTLKEAPLRVRAHGGAHICRVWPVPSLGRHVSRMHIRYLGDEGWKPTGQLFRPGPVRIEIGNDADTDIDVAIELSDRDASALPASHVLCRPEFRALFATDAPEPGVPLRAGMPCFVAVGARDPMGLCADLGDAGAFCRLQALGRYVQAIVEREGGSLTREEHETHLAVFARAADGVRAAIALQRALERFNAGFPHEPPVALRIGIHAGPALAARAQGKLDFTGQTVLLAQTFAREAHGADFVFAPDLAEHEDVEPLLAGEGIELASFTALPPDSKTLHLVRASLRDVSALSTFRVLLKR